MKRFSIWGREYGADHDVELIQVESNPEPVMKGFEDKTLSVKGPGTGGKTKRLKVRLYSFLRIVENEHP